MGGSPKTGFCHGDAEVCYLERIITNVVKCSTVPVL